MLGHRSLTVQDYITILKRRWWIIAIPGNPFPDYRVWHHLPCAAAVCFADAGSGGTAEGPRVVRQACRDGRSQWTSGFHEGTDFEPVTASADHRTLQSVCEWKDVDGRSNRPDAKEYRDRTDPVRDCAYQWIAGILYLVQGERCAHGPVGMRRDSVAFRKRKPE